MNINNVNSSHFYAGNRVRLSDNNVYQERQLILPDMRQSIFLAIDNNCCDAISKIFDSGQLSLLECDPVTGNSLLHYAIAKGSLDVAEWLIYRGLEYHPTMLGSVNNTNETPLILASFSANKSVININNNSRKEKNCFLPYQLDSNGQGSLYQRSAALMDIKNRCFPEFLRIAYKMALSLGLRDAYDFYKEALGITSISAFDVERRTYHQLFKNGWFSVSDLLHSIDVAKRNHDDEVKGLFLQPRFALRAIDSIQSQSDKEIEEALLTLIDAGVDPELLMLTAGARLQDSFIKNDNNGYYTYRGWASSNVTCGRDTLRIFELIVNINNKKHFFNRDLESICRDNSKLSLYINDKAIFFLKKIDMSWHKFGLEKFGICPALSSLVFASTAYDIAGMMEQCFNDYPDHLKLFVRAGVCSYEQLRCSLIKRLSNNKEYFSNDFGVDGRNAFVFGFYNFSRMADSRKIEPNAFTYERKIVLSDCSINEILISPAISNDQKIIELSRWHDVLPIKLSRVFLDIAASGNIAYLTLLLYAEKRQQSHSNYDVLFALSLNLLVGGRLNVGAKRSISCMIDFGYDPHLVVNRLNRYPSPDPAYAAAAKALDLLIAEYDA